MEADPCSVSPMARRRRQSRFEIVSPDPPLTLLVAPNEFLPGCVPLHFQPDPRATSAWRRVRRAVLKRDGFRCVECGGAGDEVDHRVELIDGGAPFDPTNLRTLCAACHDTKSSEARYARAARAGNAWGRMAECPRCRGSGQCPRCTVPAHSCTTCLGVRVIPESAAARQDLPSQQLLALVGPTAWCGAVRPGSGATA